MPWSTPAILILIASVLRGGSGSLHDIAIAEQFRRALTPPATRSLTRSEAPGERANATEPHAASPDPTVKPPETPRAESGAASAPGAEAPLLEKDWAARMKAARDTLEQDQLLADAMQGRVNSLTNESIGRDDPAQRAELLQQRSRALTELSRLTEQVTKDRLAIAAIEDDARKKGIPPGWIR